MYKRQFFGYSVALSGDGSTLAVGANGEDSRATGVDGDHANNSASNAGAVYIFTQSRFAWSQQAYIKASNTGALDQFGYAVAISYDGNTLAVGALTEGSRATGVGGDQNDNSAFESGAVYLFARSGSAWSQQAYIKASNTDKGDQFGTAVALSGDGNTLSVGASTEGSRATGVGGNQDDNSAEESGAVYLFTRNGSTWSQQAYIKASNTAEYDQFGSSVALSVDGNIMAVGAPAEGSRATGVDGDQDDNNADESGAVYLFARSGSTWSQQTYIKAKNAEEYDFFGNTVALSGDGNILAVGALFEDSNAIGVGGNPDDNSAEESGAVYLY